MQSAGLFLPVRQSQGMAQFNSSSRSPAVLEKAVTFISLLDSSGSVKHQQELKNSSINTAEDNLQEKLLNMLISSEACLKLYGRNSMRKSGDFGFQGLGADVIPTDERELGGRETQIHASAV